MSATDDKIDPEVFYRPGAFFLTTISGRTGWWVALAQAVAGIPSRWTHAGIIGYAGMTYEAAPGGVHYGHVSDLAHKPHIVCDAPVIEKPGQPHPIVVSVEDWEKATRGRVIYEAGALLGTPYSPLDYLALALLHLGDRLHIPKGLTTKVRQRVESSGHLICSAFVDRVYGNADIHLYNDGRLAGDVSPSDLDRWADEHNHTTAR